MRVAFEAQITPGFKVWTQDQCHELHLKSLEILERTGVVVHDEQALKVYNDGGAYVRDNIVHIPAWMVEEALRTAPERIVLKGRADRRVYLEKNQVNYGLGTEVPYFHDRHTREYRKSVLQDVIDTAIVADYLPNIDFVASLGLAGDVTTELADLYHFKAMSEHTSKPLLVIANNKDTLQGIIDMAAICVGGYEELKRNPMFMLYNEPISPLVNSKEALQKLMLASEYEIPVTYAAGITSGTTGPVTLAGTLAVGNAEGLAGLVLHQLVNPGAPFMYGIVPAPCDMATTICCYGGPEIPLYFCIIGEMGRYYNLASFGQAGATDSATVDQQAAIDAMFSILVAAQSGTNFVHDIGYIGNGLVGSLEMVVLCDECISMTKHFMKGIELNRETLALDLIHEIGHGGHFVTTDHTLKHFKKANWFPRYMNRKRYDSWVKEGMVTMNQMISEEVHNILHNHKPEPLDKKLTEEMDRIIQEYEIRSAKSKQ